jgi:signal transduction histidine kinase
LQKIEKENGDLKENSLAGQGAHFAIELPALAEKQG